jgi:uncharacterized DUF497 family protein
MEFRWIDWNIDKVHSHGVEPDEAEEVVRNARPPYPRKDLDGRRVARARTDSGRYLQIAFIIDPGGSLFVIHARPLNDREQRNFRRETR